MINLDFIKQNEGLRLNCYKDTGNNWTIGYGHLCSAYHKPITINEANELFKEDIARFISVLSKQPYYPKLNDNQRTAILDWYFNTGALLHSTLHKRLLANDLNIGDEFMKWVYVNHKVSKGLYARRLKTKQLYNTK